jgi:hypothetical protein
MDPYGRITNALKHTLPGTRAGQIGRARPTIRADTAHG